MCFKENYQREIATTASDIVKLAYSPNKDAGGVSLLFGGCSAREESLNAIISHIETEYGIGFLSHHDKLVEEIKSIEPMCHNLLDILEAMCSSNIIYGTRGQTEKVRSIVKDKLVEETKNVFNRGYKAGHQAS